MSRVPPALARRLDRLARRAHRFHRHAHHPLCPAYAGELVRLGRRAALCRGCASAGLGAGLGLALGALLSPPGGPALLLAAALLGVALRFALGARRIRWSKLLTRAAPAALATATAVWGARAASAPGLASATCALAAVGVAVLAYRRRGPDRSPCQRCPERPSAVTCRGLRHLVRREAALARLSGRLIATATAADGGPRRAGVATLQGRRGVLQRPGSGSRALP